MVQQPMPLMNHITMLSGKPGQVIFTLQIEFAADTIPIICYTLDGQTKLIGDFGICQIISYLNQHSPFPTGEIEKAMVRNGIRCRCIHSRLVEVGVNRPLDSSTDSIVLISCSNIALCVWVTNLFRRTCSSPSTNTLFRSTNKNLHPQTFRQFLTLAR